jgi:cell surface protein SprA
VQLVTAFNVTPLPSNLTFRTDLDRKYAITQLRSGTGNGSTLTTTGVDPVYQKSYYLNRSYGLRWAFTKSLSMDYRANVSAIIDEPDGEINDDLVNPGNPNSITKRDSVRKNLEKLGRIKNFDQSFLFTYRTPLDKIPLLDWTQADVNYNANYIWKAGAVGFADTLGNQIQNTRTMSLNGKMDLLKLYNKLKFLKEVNSPLTQLQQARKQKQDQWKKELENPKLNQSQKDSLRRLINKVHLSELAPVRGVFQTLMLFKNFNMTYDRTEGTIVPGFLPKPKYFGLSETDMAPGIPFILGSQDADAFKQNAIDNNWIANSKYQSSPLVQTKSIKLTYRTSVEPFKQFRVQFDGRQEQTQVYNEYFRFDPTDNTIETQNPTRSGSFKTSYITALTAFAADDPVTNKNANFEKFSQNTAVIAERLQQLHHTSSTAKYDTGSQDVLIPAFLAAYTGQDPNKVALSAFPKIPVPNWRIDYGGLSSIGFIKQYFSSVNLQHSYSSTYSVNNYTSSLTYGKSFISPNTSIFNLPLGDSVNSQNTYTPVYVISGVSIQEAFSPLLGVNMKTKKNISFSVRYNYTRNLNLSVSNAQVQEMRKKDWTVSVGYTKTGMKLPIKSKQRSIVLKNEITFRLDISISDTRTVQRKINDVNVITQGIEQIQIKPTINYRVNDRLSLQLYYDETITIPHISNSFKRTNTTFGLQIRFSLS